ncbi:MAG: trypsin-like peptidase domain-containing protein [Porticoccaceae bacterium]|nr:trypsin-like peptidase domain-containing protein [Porticoccaceae bacterium]
MAKNQGLRLAIDFIRLPVITGLAVAALLLLVFPEFRGDSIRANPALNESGGSGPVSYAQAVKKAAPSVVNIYTKTKVKRNAHRLSRHPFFKRMYKQQPERVEGSLGSGVIIDKTGFIVTSFHVVDSVDEILILLYDGRELPAKIVGTDPETDLAVLKIDTDNLQEIQFGDPNKAEIGDVVLAIGNPFGMGQTVTQGIVSATQRNGLNLNNLENYIQTDADINPGNSGGALIDAYGNLLGINAAILNNEKSDGIGFAIPADEVEKVLAHIIEYGRVVRGWLGVEAIEVTQTLAKKLSLDLSNGLLVTATVEDGPTEQAGILPGDIVTSINGLSVTDRHRSISQIAEIFPGQPIELIILRNQQLLTITAIAGERPATN